MRLFRVFLAHELITQWRSVRFRGLAAVYVVVASATSIGLFVMTGRTPRIFGPAATGRTAWASSPCGADKGHGLSGGGVV